MNNSILVSILTAFLVGCGRSDSPEEVCYRASKALSSEMNRSATNEIAPNASFDTVSAARRWKEKVCPVELK